MTKKDMKHVQKIGGTVAFRVYLWVNLSEEGHLEDQGVERK